MRIYSLLIPVVVLETEYPFKFYSEATIVQHIPDWVRIFNTPGHTPYHLSFLVQGNSRRAIITGDRVPNRDYFFEEGKGFIEVDMDRRMAKASELRIRRYAEGCGKSIIYPSHDRPFFFRTGRYVQKNPYEVF